MCRPTVLLQPVVVSPVPCEAHASKGTVVKRWEQTQPVATRVCVPDFDEEYEDKSDFGEFQHFSWSPDPSEHINRHLLRSNSKYGDGGFIQDLEVRKKSDPESRSGCVKFRSIL